MIKYPTVAKNQKINSVQKYVEGVSFDYKKFISIASSIRSDPTYNTFIQKVQLEVKSSNRKASKKFRPCFNKRPYVIFTLKKFTTTI